MKRRGELIFSEIVRSMALKENFSLEKNLKTMTQVCKGDIIMSNIYGSSEASEGLNQGMVLLVENLEKMETLFANNLSIKGGPGIEERRMFGKSISRLSQLNRSKSPKNNGIHMVIAISGK